MECPELREKWWRDPVVLVAEVERHGNSRATAARVHAETGSTPSKLAKAWSDFGLPALRDGRPPKNADGITRAKKEFTPGLTIDGSLATLVTPPTPYQLGDIETMLRERGLDPDEWAIDRAVVNEWDANAGRDEDGEVVVIKLRQLKVMLKRKPDIDWLFPAVEVAKRWMPPKAKARKGKSKPTQLAVICGDQQAIYHDEGLHEAFCRWLADVQPELGALTGDSMDLPTISRHSDRPNWDATPQACIDGAFRLLSDYRDASPATRWRKLRGNHDIRLESELLNRAERMYGLKPAAIPGREQIPGYSIRNLLHLDALGIELVGAEGEKWELAELTLASGVTVRHRLPTKEKTSRLGRTILAGDSHRQSIRCTTLWDGDEARTITLVEVGCMCSLDGLGYTFAPDWQQGFATAAITEGAPAGIDLAKWNGERLVWRGQSW